MKLKLNDYDKEMVMMYNDEMNVLVCSLHVSNLSVDLIRDLNNLEETGEESIYVDFYAA